MANFCPGCGAAVEGMKFCAECGTPLDGASPIQAPVAHALPEDEQAAILDGEIAALTKYGWQVHGRPTPYEVSLKRNKGETARQFLTLWVEEDGSLWTNQFGVMNGGRLRDFPILFSNPYNQVEIHPYPWTPTTEAYRKAR